MPSVHVSHLKGWSRPPPAIPPCRLSRRRSTPRPIRSVPQSLSPQEELRRRWPRPHRRPPRQPRVRGRASLAVLTDSATEGSLAVIGQASGWWLGGQEPDWRHGTLMSATVIKTLDIMVRRLDDARYARKFTPRRADRDGRPRIARVMRTSPSAGCWRRRDWLARRRVAVAMHHARSSDLNRSGYRPASGL